MRVSVRIDPSSDASNDVEPTGDLDVETAASPDQDSTTKDSPGEPGVQSDYQTTQDRAKVTRRQSLDLGLQKQSNRSRKEGLSRRASVNTVGIFPEPTADSTQQDTASRHSSAGSESDSPMENTKRSKRMWNAISHASHEINRESRRVFSLLRKRIRGQRGQKETSVKEIQINPDAIDERWACRSVSATSTTTSCTSGSSNFHFCGPIDASNPHIVHDTNDEYNPEYR